jgi:hypothetical protein
LRIIPESIVKSTLAQLHSGSAVGGSDRVELHFGALKRMLDRAGKDYAS